MLTANELRSFIMNGLPCDHVEVLGDDGQHFEAVIVSPAFQGKRTLQHHQLVYGVLGSRMHAEIHALSMKTFTPEEWSKQV
ncbi:BolA family protein [Sulfuricella sp.]|uniref:BolA family protein n=1 Tax=Sulfuricella sp. TaxID=2099377 RepID=UPI002C4E6B1C|nr:BolA/IbaG family iron-sulfur metabolism protein [Sulfuricella sp.]HUX63817.1 BolA/IbaG family iron-sulfur metabolism protein [Sulfuricella sp.]